MELLFVHSIRNMILYATNHLHFYGRFCCTTWICMAKTCLFWACTGPHETQKNLASPETYRSMKSHIHFLVNAKLFALIKRMAKMQKTTFSWLQSTRQMRLMFAQSQTCSDCISYQVHERGGAISYPQCNWVLGIQCKCSYPRLGHTPLHSHMGKFPCSHHQTHSCWWLDLGDYHSLQWQTAAQRASKFNVFKSWSWLCGLAATG